jgi:hypothetical protein
MHQVIDLAVVCGRSSRTGDPLGGADVQDGVYRDVCLIRALQALGVPVRADRDGPFRAGRDGNAMINHLGFELVRSSYDNVATGNYVRFCRRTKHFVAVVVGELITETDGSHIKTHATLEDLTIDGRPDRYLWWRLVNVNDQTSEAAAQASLSTRTAQAEFQRRCSDVFGQSALLKREVRFKRHMQNVPKVSSTLSMEQQERIALNRAEAKRRRDGMLARPVPPDSWTHPLIPEPPTSFASRPSLPPMEFLAVLNRHPRDVRLRFYENEHVYLLDGRPTLGSVTGLIHQFTQHFDGHTVAIRMVQGVNWPRAGYLRERISVETLAALRSRASTEQLYCLLTAADRNEHCIAAMARRVLSLDPAARSLVQEIAMDTAEILEQWETNRITAANRGTYMHWTFEAWLNRAIVSHDSVEFRLFSQFVHGLRGVTAYRTEWMIFADQECLAGSIDFVGMLDDGRVVIYDWKRSANLRNKYTNQYQKMVFPFDHLDDCQGNHYRLQLNMYKYILETYYEVSVAAMYVVCTHPDNEVYGARGLSL